MEKTLRFKEADLADDYFESVQGKPVGFCPIANIQCNSRCVCYVDARRQPEGDSDWVVYPPYCDNHMYWGE